ncbi:MAG: App1 family protein [Thermoanaerobaculia bacterium]
MSRPTVGFRRGAIAFLRRLERGIDRARAGRGADARPLRIETYRSYGTAASVHLKGRVLRGRGAARAEPGEGRWRALAATARRVLSPEAAGVPVAGWRNGHRAEGVTNEEGYFHLELPGRAGEEGWVEGEVRAGEAEAVARVLVPPAGAAFGVISDVDDTVIRTDATSLWRMIRTVALANAHVRLPFEGVAAFYRALHGEVNPLFYVSSSPWNLYDLLDHVFELRGIPEGPLLLQDWGIEPEKLVLASHDTHKREQIDAIVGTYPALSFVLIGDSGQRDPEIYDAVARHYPGRMRVVYIRHVATEARRREVEKIAAALAREAGVEMLLVADTVEAARDAAARGLIAPDTLPEIAGEKASDEAAEESL